MNNCTIVKLSNRSAFAELEATTGLGLTGLLALHGTRVAGHETFGAEGLLVLGIDLHECAGNGQTESLALSGEAATVNVHLDVVLLCGVEQRERLLHHELQDRAGEVGLKGFLVDGNITSALCYINAGNGALTAS